MTGRRPLARTRYCSRYTHSIGADRLGNVLDAMAAERAVIKIELVPDFVVDRLRNANGARLSERLEPGGDVDAIPEDVVAVDDGCRLGISCGCGARNTRAE
jgi:hypothetical protein